MSKKQDDPNDATTLGLRNQYDLKPRKDVGGVFGSMKHDLGPALPAADEPLWMDKSVLTSCEHAADDGNRRSKSKRKSAAKIPFSYLRPRNRPQQAVEAETSAGSGGPKTDAPCAPVTAAQLKDCTRVLLPNEISQLSAGPSSLNFGSVAVGSRHTQYFAFTNGTAKAVLVRMETKREGSVAYSEATTRYSTGSSMVTESEQLSDECGVLSLSSMGERACVKVIEPGATNHFGVFFEATAGTHDLKTLTFKDQIGYTINDNPNHVFSFDVSIGPFPNPSTHCFTSNAGYCCPYIATYRTLTTFRVTIAGHRGGSPRGAGFERRGNAFFLPAERRRVLFRYQNSQSQ
jgi:hypothetical protein